jgi:hypothetical protein
MEKLVINLKFSQQTKKNSQTPLLKIKRKTHIPSPLPKEKKP